MPHNFGSKTMPSDTQFLNWNDLVLVLTQREANRTVQLLHQPVLSGNRNSYSLRLQLSEEAYHKDFIATFEYFLNTFMETKLQAGIYLQTLHKEIFNKNSAKKVILPTKDYHICMTNMPEYASTNRK